MVLLRWSKGTVGGISQFPGRQPGPPQGPHSAAPWGKAATAGSPPGKAGAAEQGERRRSPASGKGQAGKGLCAGGPAAQWLSLNIPRRCMAAAVAATVAPAAVAALWAPEMDVRRAAPGFYIYIHSPGGGGCSKGWGEEESGTGPSGSPPPPQPGTSQCLPRSLLQPRRVPGRSSAARWVLCITLSLPPTTRRRAASSSWATGQDPDAGPLWAAPGEAGGQPLQKPVFCPQSNPSRSQKSAHSLRGHPPKSRKGGLPRRASTNVPS